MKVIPMTALLIVSALALPAFAQEDIRILQLARFESETDYQAYSDWIGDMENIRFAIIANGKRWTPTVEAWAKDYIQNPANVESNDDIYLITYAEGGLDKKAARLTLETLVGAYGERVRRHAAHESQALRKRLDMEIAAMNRDADPAALGQDDDSLHLELRDINERLLKAKLQAAQAEARARALMEFEQKRYADASDKKPESEASDLRRELAERKLLEARRRMEEVLALHKNNLVSEKDVGKAEIAMSEAQLDLVELRDELERRETLSLDPSLHPMLIEAEAERASALALDKVLREQDARLRALLEKQREFKDRKRDLELEMKKLNAFQSQPRRAPGGMNNPFGNGAPRMIHPES